jgi:hypothetical protein
LLLVSTIFFVLVLFKVFFGDISDLAGSCHFALFLALEPTLVALGSGAHDQPARSCSRESGRQSVVFADGLAAIEAEARDDDLAWLGTGSEIHGHRAGWRGSDK